MQKALDTTWHSGVLYKSPKSGFSTSLIKLINSFLTDRKCEILVEGEFSTARELARIPQDSVCAPILYRLYINDAPMAAGAYLALFADDICIYTTEKDERRVFCKTAKRPYCSEVV
jgi:hypothetical protein